VVHTYTAGNEPYSVWEGLERGSKEYEELKQQRAETLWKVRRHHGTHQDGRWPVLPVSAQHAGSIGSEGCFCAGHARMTYVVHTGTLAGVWNCCLSSHLISVTHHVLLPAGPGAVHPRHQAAHRAVHDRYTHHTRALPAPPSGLVW